MKIKGQSFIEYVVLIGIVIAALLGMQVYLKRAVQGNFKNYAGQIGEGESYSPQATNGITITGTRITESSKNWVEEEADAAGVETKFTFTKNEVLTNSTIDRSESTLSLADEPRRW